MLRIARSSCLAVSRNLLEPMVVTLGMATYRPPPTPNLARMGRAKVHVYAWGRGDLGQLGAGVEGNVLEPQPVEALEGKDIVHATGNVYNTAFVTDDGELFITGSNDSGQLGTRNREIALAPVRVDALDTYRISHVALGQNHTVALTDQGNIASWGASEFGQLGQGTEGGDQPHPKLIKSSIRDPHYGEGCHLAVAYVGKVPAPEMWTMAACGCRVAAGACHTLALTGSGHVYAFGQGTFGALGQGNEENVTAPALIPRLWPIGVVQVACGENHSAALAVDGSLLTWGRGKYGQLGHGDFATINTPTLVQALRGVLGVQVACGGDHTVLLESHGQVMTWGRGTWGQTGLGTTDNTCRPNLVQALQNEVIVQVSAGYRHTVALSRQNEVFAFGNGEQGQLGSGVSKNALSPKRMEGLPNLPILFVAAAGDHVHAVVREVGMSEEPLAMHVGPHPARSHGQGCMPLRLPHFKELAEAAAHDGEHKQRALLALIQAIEDVFTSPGFLVAGFMLPPDRQQPVPDGGALVPHHLDVEAVDDVYQGLLKLFSTEAVAALGGACIKLLDGIEKQQSETANRQNQHPEWLKVLLILFQNPLNSEAAGVGSSLLTRLTAVTLALPPESRTVLATWLAGLPPEIFGARVVRPLQKFITWLINAQGWKKARGEVLRVGEVLALLHGANERAGRPLPFSEFHSRSISESANLKEEYLVWVQHVVPTNGKKRSSTTLSLCQLPFLLLPEAKSRILQGESTLQKQAEMNSSVSSGTIIAALMGGHPLDPTALAFLNIRVRRDSILQDSLDQIISRPRDLKKPLRVTFVSNGVAEEGLDEGGVSREFFQLLVDEIFNPDYGMFTYSEETRTFWFSTASLESQVEFQLVGIVLGLAIYNGVILDVHFPIVLYKKLLGLTPTFADLKEAMPTLGRSLQALLDYKEEDFETVFDLTFEMEYDFFGEMRKVELLPGGSKMSVTLQNRQQYVDLYTHWTLVTAVEQQFKAFAHGFHQVCGGPALTLFRHEELELLVAGLPHLDFNELEKGARYEGGYHKDHPAVRWFWSILHSLPLEQKKRFLAFTTGCDRAPVGGLSQLVLTIQRGGPDSDRLPTSHTCFNVMLLPEYSSKEKMQERLLIAIENAQGFGLQ